MQTWTDDEMKEIREISEPYSPRLSNRWTVAEDEDSNIFVLANAAWWQTEGCRQMQCRHEILRHELLYAPSLFLSDANYEVSYIGLKAQNIYQELETCLKIIWFSDNNIPVAAFFKAQDTWMEVPRELREHYKFAKKNLGHKVKIIFDSVSPVSQNMLRHAYCQSALKFDPLSACNIDPPEWHGGGCPGSQQGGPARLRVALCATRSEAAWGVPVGPPGQPGRGDGRRRTMNGS